jgi:hypothetical protein
MEELAKQKTVRAPKIWHMLTDLPRTKATLTPYLANHITVSLQLYLRVFIEK